MSRKPGLPKTGGRSAGTPNKSVIPLREICERVGCDPFEVLIKFAAGDWKGLNYPSETQTIEGDGWQREEYYITPQMRVHAAKEACTYLHPKRKAIEHSNDPENPINGLNLAVMSEADLKKLIKDAIKE